LRVTYESVGADNNLQNIPHIVTAMTTRRRRMTKLRRADSASPPPLSPPLLPLLLVISLPEELLSILPVFPVLENPNGMFEDEITSGAADDERLNDCGAADDDVCGADELMTAIGVDEL